MKIKTKLALACGLLFLLITVLSALAIRQVNVLAQDTKNILVDNYLSLDYSRNMYKILDKSAFTNEDIAKFKNYLNQQNNNVTETGEKELTDDLNEHFNELQKDISNPGYIKNVRNDLNAIMKLNMDSIQRKSNMAENTAESSVLWISLTSAFCFIIGFTLIINLPGYIANPIRDLTESIKQIAAKNYAQRVYFKSHDEFFTLAKSFNSMAEKLQEYSNTSLDKLMMEKKRIETLINNMHDPVIGLDENGKILFINEEALKISGLKKEEVDGKPAIDVALHNDLIRTLLQTSNKEETLKIYADSKESYFEKAIVPISIIPTGETERKTVGSFILLKNITPYKELDFAKTNFIATVSHEFKTPIASMKMSLQLLENEQTGGLNDEQKNLVHGLKDDADRLLRTTGELLNITQVETGKSQLKIESCDVTEIIDNALSSTEKLAEQKGIRINKSLPDFVPEIIADSEKATWIISNLLSNAVRYSYDDSSITVTAKASDLYVEIAVQDNGVGIDTKYQQKVFDKYFRVPGTEKEGTGLGLAISKEFVEAMGGTIKVVSKPGEGSIFTLAFKRAF